MLLGYLACEGVRLKISSNVNIRGQEVIWSIRCHFPDQPHMTKAITDLFDVISHTGQDLSLCHSNRGHIS